MMPGSIYSTGTAGLGADSERIYRLVNYLKCNVQKMHSLIIIHKGCIIADAHFYPFHREVAYYQNCCTASIISALVGIALDDGLIGSMSDKAAAYFPEYAQIFNEPHKGDITIEHLLQMNTGIEWDDVNNLFGENNYDNRMHRSENPVKFVLQQPMKEEPGKRFNHCLGAPHVLSAILQKVTGRCAAEYAEDKLFKPLGINGTEWFKDLNGISTGGNGLVMTAEGLARIGQLFLQKGKWEGRQIISEDWIKQSTRKHVDTQDGPWSFYGSGYLWNINRFGGYCTKGVNGQYMAVVPNLNLVVVMIGQLTAEERFWPETLMETFIIPAVRLGSLRRGDPYREKLKELTDEISNPPVPAAAVQLPAIASQISGRRIVFKYPDKLCEVSFGFSKKDCCIYKINHEQENRELTAGLDGIYRVAANEAAKGEWLNTKTLLIKMLHMGMDYEIEHKYTFYKDKVVYEDISPWIKGHEKVEGKFLD